MNLDEIDFDGPYDLIWVGSFFTHVGAEDWRQMLAQFESLLSPRGVVVFTAYGREIVEAVRRGGNKLDLKDEHVEQIVRDYDDEGFGFFPDFNPAANRGDALARRSWVCTQLERFPSLELMLYVEHGWLGQDVIACARAKGSG
jgi:hypothetical protein